jgi:serine/threonine protein kinase/tetratricopeptide (TPR) repeat protein
LPDLGSARLEQFGAAVRADPERVGPYRILARIGQGGMGVVYQAEQREPVRRTVALKLIRLGMDSEQVLARFESERQALALMDHPHVAKVLDAGTTEGGRPFFVMEFVAGEPITTFCDRLQYTTARRLELFLQACEAVQHAHQKAIIHRDLKPSNILVSDVDGKPHVKVIDFGVAKALTRKLTDRTLHTLSDQLVGTPEYMSPEQAAGSLDVDTRTDVYALGVVLYELLCGALPFDPSSLRSAGYVEIQRILRDVDPPRPSAKLSSLGAVADQLAQRRQAHAEQLTGQLRRELEWIPLKAMHKERTRRYATADQLADDVRNYLAHRPLLAGPEVLSYRARKFVRRNKGAVVAVTAVVVALLVGGIVSSALAIRLKRTADAVRAEQRTTQAVLQFLLDDVLGGANPEVGRSADLTVKQALDNAAGAVPGKFAAQPLVEAVVRHTFADTYLALGLPEAALPHARAAAALRRRALGDDHPETIAAQSDLGLVYHTMGNLNEAESIYRDILDRARRALGNEHRHTLTAISNLAMLYGQTGKPAEAEPLLREALAYRRRTLGDDHPDTLMLMNNLGGLLQWQKKFPEAESLFRQVLAGRRRALGADHPETLTAMTNLGGMLQEQGKLTDAEPHFREALGGRRRVLGDDHPDTLQSMHIVGRSLMRQDRPAEAEPLFAEVYRRVPGAKLEPKRAADLMCNWGICLARLGRLAEAEPALREAERRFKEVGAPVPEQVRAALAHVERSATAPAIKP